jgi:hypothetical protein
MIRKRGRKAVSAEGMDGRRSGEDSDLSEIYAEAVND